jgi:hypothetical protein
MPGDLVDTLASALELYRPALLDHPEGGTEAMPNQAAALRNP